GIFVLRRPHHCFRADQPGNPDGGMRLLQRQDPRIDEAIMEMLTLKSEGPWPGPGLDYKFMCFVKIFTIIGWIGVIEELLAARSANKSRHQATPGQHIDHCQLFRQSEWI